LINNPSLRSQPRHENAPIIQKNNENTILNWLEGTGRMIDRDVVLTTLISDEDDLTNALLGTDDMDFDDDLEGGDDED
jgi:Protein of unknown function (DUF3134)